MTTGHPDRHLAAVCECVSTAALCSNCFDQRLGQLKGVARRRGDELADGLAQRIPRERPWPGTTPAILAIARLKVADLTRDQRLIEQLAVECAGQAGRRWSAEAQLVR